MVGILGVVLASGQGASIADTAGRMAQGAHLVQAAGKIAGAPLRLGCRIWGLPANVRACLVWGDLLIRVGYGAGHGCGKVMQTISSMASGAKRIRLRHEPDWFDQVQWGDDGAADERRGSRASQHGIAEGSGETEADLDDLAPST